MARAAVAVHQRVRRLERRAGTAAQCVSSL
jgi:hypothetical protein